jgi:hypothetical protein
MAEENIDEKIQSEEDSSDKPKKKKKKKKKKIQLEEGSIDKPKKKKKKKVQSEEGSLDQPKKKKKKKKKALSKGTKAIEFPVKKWAIRVLILVACIGGFFQMQESSKAKALAKTYMTSLAALNKLQISCSALWSEIGIAKVCDQDLGEKAIGKYAKDVKLTIIEGRSHRFTAEIKHKEGDRVFQVNKKGDLFLNTDGCLSKIMIMNPDVESIQKMASNCKTPAS